MSAKNAITIRPLRDMPNLHAVEDLQRTVWGMPEREIVPSHQLLAAVSAGGTVLGAFTEAERLVGFCYGFIGMRDGQLLFYSHLAGVLEEYRGSGVGFLLKRAQRDVALARGVDRMVWTYDPLTSMNAYFNLHKLGAVARRYYVNYYGEMTDALNRGLPSDRVEIDWWLRQPRVETLMSGQKSAPVWENGTLALAAVPEEGGMMPGEPVFNLHQPVLRIQTPTEFARIRERNLQLARAWRMVTRRVFLHYFDQGYAAVDYVLEQNTDRLGSYVLEAQSSPERPASKRVERAP